MPIYAYRCASCGNQQDVLQKMSDALLTECPACHTASFQKQVTAAGFQLKGSGWYVTDFRNGSGKSGAKSDDKGAEKSPDSGSTDSTTADKDTGKSEGKGADKGGTTTDAAAAATTVKSSASVGLKER